MARDRRPHAGGRRASGYRQYSASRSKRTSRQVNERMVGTHVARTGQGSARTASRHGAGYIESAARRARIRRIAAGVAAVAIVLAIALAAGFLAFRGTVGGELALRGSDAPEALVSAKSGEPAYALVAVELGSVAAPLDNAGPDVILLARLDPQSRTIALVNVPPSLQVTSDNVSHGMASIGQEGDAALIAAVSSFAKVDISHYVKVEEGGLAGIVDALGGIEVDVSQTIDDPHAGTDYIPSGTRLLDGGEAITYLRATNLEYGAEDQLANQLRFAAAVMSAVFSNESGIAARMESIGPFLQTDMSLSEIEGVHSWLGGVDAGDITCAVAPGYFTVATNASSDAGSRFIGSSSDMAVLIDDLENGRQPSVGYLEEAQLADPSGFVVDVENGTTVEGAASSAAGLLKSKGFRVGDVGNAEQPVFDETLVVYKSGDEGLARANAVIDALGVGRAVEESSYYTFEDDVLLIIGADNKPVA